jgi:nucleotide-binding universal stress UspA family protein
MPARPVLIAYDGSENADRAIAVAGELLGGGPAEVVHAYEPVTSAAARSAIYAAAFDATGAIAEREREQAGEVAARGVELAKAAGFDATGDARGGAGPLWATIVDRAAELDPRVIVMGTRGLTGLRSALSGSVSHGVASHATQPVLTIPLHD